MGDGKPAARIGDTTATGGAITSGWAGCQVCHMPAARKGDTVVDPVYGPSMMASHSTTVFIGGSPAARLLDFAAPSASKSGQGVPPVVGPGMQTKSFNATTDPKKRTAKKALEEDKGVGPHAEGSLQDLNKDGIPDHAQIEGGAAKFQFEKAVDPHGGSLAGGGKFDGGFFEFKGQATQAQGVGGVLGAEGAMARLNLEGALTNGTGSMVSGGGTGQLLHGVAGGDAWAGRNPATGDWGLKVDGGLKGEVLTGELRGAVTVPAAKLFLPWLPDSWAKKIPIIGDYQTTLSGAVSGDIAAAGADGKLELTYNPKDERLRAGIGGDLAAGLGIGVDLFFTFEKIKPAPAKSPMPPSGGAAVVNKGAPTVKIGK